MSERPILTMRRARQLETVHRAITMGLAAAASHLSAFVGKEIIIEAPRLGLCAVEQLVECALGSAFDLAPERDAESVMTGIYLGVTGDVEGHFLMLLSPDDARALVAPLIAELDPPAEKREELIHSAQGEVGNITASGLLNALADATKLRISPSCPAVVTDMAGAILEMPLLDIAQIADEALYIETSITMDTFATTGALALIPRPEGLDALIRGLTAAEAREGKRK
jgi:chemotaxis protein CheC